MAHGVEAKSNALGPSSGEDLLLDWDQDLLNDLILKQAWDLKVGVEFRNRKV